MCILFKKFGSLPSHTLQRQGSKHTQTSVSVFVQDLDPQNAAETVADPWKSESNQFARNLDPCHLTHFNDKDQNTHKHLSECLYKICIPKALQTALPIIAKMNVYSFQEIWIPAISHTSM